MMMRLKSIWSIAGLLFGPLILVIPYVLTCYLATKPSSAHAAVSPSPEPLEYNQASLEGTLLAFSQSMQQPLVYSLPAPAPTPSSTCTGLQKLAHESMWPWFQYLRCASSKHPGCDNVACHSPYALTLHQSLCGCVLPIQVQLTLDVPLDALFEAIPMLLKDIASGVRLMQNQARIVGLNEDSDDQSKSSVEIELVPSGSMFDNATVSMIFKRFHDHEVLSYDSLFQKYTVVSIRYPGFSFSTASSFPRGTNSGVLPRAGLYPHQKPLSVDVTSRNEKINGGTIAVIVVSSIVAIAAVLGGYFLVILKINNLAIASSSTKSSPTSECRRSGGVLISSSEHENPDAESMSPKVESFCVLARKYSFYELQRATKNFDANNVLGQGGSGQVFFGKLDDGRNVAVKLITGIDHLRGKEFIAEVEMLCRLHHRNVVKLIGVCIEKHCYCLVYELISNGSLESLLHDTSKAVRLDWNTRLKIALGAARGLAYLHEDVNPCVIHRDFKASNILLEEDFTPKVSDFGLAKAAADEKNEHNSPEVMGTFGYVAPEYAMTGHLLVKSDVYSYGVVLLELLSGRKAVDLSQPAGGESLVMTAHCLLASEEGLERLVDPTLEGHVPLDNFAKVAAIAMKCVHADAFHRPFMGEVVQALKVVCNFAEDGSSAIVSPQDSGGESELACGSISEPINVSNNTSFLSLDYDSGTACAVERANIKHESFFTTSSNSNQSLAEPHNLFRRHSISGPCETRVNSPWSSEILYARGSVHVKHKSLVAASWNSDQSLGGHSNLFRWHSISGPCNVRVNSPWSSAILSAHGSSSEPINVSNNTCFLSLDYDSGTACAVERVDTKHESFFVSSSDSGQSRSEANNLSRRHSISGPCTVRVNSSWSSGIPYAHASSSNPISVSSNTCFLSLNYDSGTTCAVERVGIERESHFAASLCSDQSLGESNNLSRRHSISGPCTARVNSPWSSDVLNARATISELINVSSNTCFLSLDNESGRTCAVERADIKHESFLIIPSNSDQSLGEANNMSRRHVRGPCTGRVKCPWSSDVLNARGSSSEPPNVSDYDSGTVCAGERANNKHKSFFTPSTNSHRPLGEPNNLYRRHSISGPCTARADSPWSSEILYTQITMSESRI